MTARRKNRANALVICNGSMLPKKEIVPMLRPRPFIVCADGGANKARKLGIRPDVIIGDMDSITLGTERYFSDVEKIHLGDQYSTDLEKALELLIKRGIGRAIVLGATGGRPDHSFANLSILKKYRKKIRLLFSDPAGDIRIIERQCVFVAKAGTVVSLMPLGRCEGIWTTGLRYPLRNESLELGVREGASNEVISSPVRIAVKRGCLLLFVTKANR